jgi:hypothetical protein
MMIFDSVKTIDFDKKHLNPYNKAVFRLKMQEYGQHAACCLLWKKYIYTVGGEIEGNWSPNGYKLDLETF